MNDDTDKPRPVYLTTADLRNIAHGLALLSASWTARTDIDRGKALAQLQPTRMRIHRALTRRT